MRPVTLSAIVYLFCFACGGLIKESINQDPERQAIVIQSTPVYDGMIAVASNTTFTTLKPFSKVYVKHDSLSINDKKFVGVAWHQDSSGYVPVGSLMLKGKLGVVTGAYPGNKVDIFRDRDLKEKANDSFNDWQLVAGRTENSLAEVMFLKGSSTVKGYVPAQSISFDSLDLELFYASREAERQEKLGETGPKIELFRNEKFSNLVSFKNHFAEDNLYQEYMTSVGRAKMFADQEAAEAEEASVGQANEEENKEQYTSFAELEWLDDSGNVVDGPGSVGIYLIDYDGKVSPTINSGAYMFNGELNVEGVDYKVNGIKVVFLPELARTDFTIEINATNPYREDTYDFAHKFTNASCCTVAYTFVVGDSYKLACSRMTFTFKGEGVTSSISTTCDCGE